MGVFTLYKFDIPLMPVRLTLQLLNQQAETKVSPSC